MNPGVFRLGGVAAVLVAAAVVAGEYKPIGEVQRLDARIDELVPADATIEILDHGFLWTEGPVWIPRDGGYLLFSDIPRNSIMKWREGEGSSIFLKPSGYTGVGPYGGEPGTNGLLLEADGKLVMCEHGDRRITRLVREQDAIKEVIASQYEGKRLNSPNDAVFHSSGTLYFTDPPYGLPNRYEDERRELDWCGVYRVAPGREPELLTKEMTRPNGIGFSPDEKTLYVAQSDPEAAIWKAFPVKPDGTLGKSRLIHDATERVGKDPGLPDGMAVDAKGNLFATGPGGVWVFSPEGDLLGKLYTGERTSNCTFGGDDGDELYITVDMYLCRVRLNTTGIGHGD